MVARFIFGLGSLHRLPFPSQRQRVIRAAMDVGFRAFDVAPAYGNGLDELELGLALKGRRKDVSINTKFGIPMPLYGGRFRSAFPFLRVADKLANPSYSRRYQRRCFAPGTLIESLHGSLRRLRTDYVDCLLLHEPLQPIPQGLFEDIAATAGKLKDEGLIRMFGTAGTLKSLGPCIAHPALEVIQAPLAEIKRAANLAGKTTIAYSVYQAFKEEGGQGGFKDYVANLQRQGTSLALILATTRLATLNSFRDMLT